MQSADNPIEFVRQKKLDSLAAKYLHLQALSKLNKRNQMIDFLGLAVPAGYLVVRFLAKGTDAAEIAEFSWELLAGALFVMSLSKMAFHWQEKAQEHSKLMGENIVIVGAADNLLADQASIEKERQSFSLLVQKSEREDRNLLGMPSDEDRQFAYREALKEFGGVNVVCPFCKASPYKYTCGACQQCGNVPFAEPAKEKL